MNFDEFVELKRENRQLKLALTDMLEGGGKKGSFGSSLSFSNSKNTTGVGNMIAKQDGNHPNKLRSAISAKSKYVTI